MEFVEVNSDIKLTRALRQNSQLCPPRSLWGWEKEMILYTPADFQELSRDPLVVSMLTSIWVTQPIFLRPQLWCKLPMKSVFPWGSLKCTLNLRDYIFSSVIANVTSRMFGQRKPNDKLRLFFDLRIYSLFRTVSKHWSPSQHLVRYNETFRRNFTAILCNFECTQVYACLQMNDESSVWVLNFIFASRTFVYPW